MPLITRERASARAGTALIERSAGTNEGITMNSTTSETLEARESPRRSVTSGVVHSAASQTVSRATLADRMALRLGMALVIWSRQHAARQDVRLDLRVVVLARRAETEDRRALQLSTDRRALAGLPRR
jgi:hypothetical protein